MRETRRLVRIEMIKKDVMKKLKLEALPKVNSSINISALPVNLWVEPGPGDHHDEDVEGTFQTIIFGERREYHTVIQNTYSVI